MLIIVVSFILNMLMCCMSPIRDYLFSYDSNCFYMAGRSWYHGYIPYVDFIDTKGPLLFLIYAIGYAISPAKTTGMYIIASISTTITLIFLYRIAYLYTRCVFKSLLTISLCTIGLFYIPFYGYGARTEQFLLPFVAWLFYSLCIHIPDLKKNSKSWIYLGICLGTVTAATLLTKYVYIIFPGCTTIVTLILFCREKNQARNIFLFAICYFFSFLALTLPFVSYMVSTQSWDDFLWVYFSLGAKYSTPGNLSFVEKISYLVLLCVKRITFWAPALGMLILFSPFYKIRMEKKQQLIILLSSFSLIACTRIGLYTYYALLFTPILIFILLPFVNKCSFQKKWMFVGCGLAIAAGIGYNYILPKRKEMKTLQNAPVSWRQDYNNIEEIIKSKESPKIMYLDYLSVGLGVKAKALPACPAWFLLNCGGKEVVSISENAIKNKQADFVITQEKTKKSNISLLSNSGYKVTAIFLNKGAPEKAMMLWKKL